MSTSTPPPGGVVKVALPAALVTALITALATNAITTATAKPAHVEPSEVTAKEFDALRTDVRELRSDMRTILLRLGEVSDTRNNARVIERARSEP